MKPAPLHERTTPKQIAAYWLNRNRSGAISADEVRAFQVWIERDAGNRVAYDEIERLWSVFGGVSEDPSIIASCEAESKRYDAFARVRAFAALAAGLAVVAVGGWMALGPETFSKLNLSASSGQVLRTSIGQRTMVTLRDGSVVTLDTDTVLRLRESFRERRVELVKGRAYFQVARDKYRPFIVAAAGKTVRATGTAFDVRVDPERFQVTLVEGRVRVEEPTEKGDPQSAEMRVGWRLVVAKDAHWRMIPVDVKRETSWHDGRLAFLRDPLVDAVAEMNRYSDRKIVFRGEKPTSVVIGVFRAGDVEGFVTALELNKLARVVARDDTEIEIVAR